MFANYTFKAERGRRRTGMAFASGERENASERVRGHLNDERKPGTIGGRSTFA